uniref:Uncharacterized protein n=1 Tax=Anopheles culicifacies TaxID=139723 RepID=A0A182LU43_9DIPT
MNFHSDECSSWLNCTTYDTGSSDGPFESEMNSRMNSNFGPHYPSSIRYQNTRGCIQSDGWSSMDIQLLNDEHEKAILNDLYKTAGAESTPLTTFSYISEYICSNNIDIWPGELISSSNKDGQLYASTDLFEM